MLLTLHFVCPIYELYYNLLIRSLETVVVRSASPPHWIPLVFSNTITEHRAVAALLAACFI